MVMIDTPVASPLKIRFDQYMDETVVPTPPFWDIEIDGVPRAATVSAWGADNSLEVSFGGIAPAVSAMIGFDSIPTALKNLDGIQAVQPQSVFNVV